ncbi:phosphoribosylaminoimidazolesuccinocarboxamide synthase [Bifidobacterium psychraerophilum]|jgi:phosphoribosylaminoimidazole-succinocarboxamide synthase|uniref:phosphoribosylaminoimidazolesuccinocarboxamide synthase n=1 Tax=Bifidobacterium psychraerophilum TaxID=218140 RepID=UPI0023F154EE|nr:phosphoribosylaminoimidazolesuccinocarboxamide synthase [Bifidobacterium psychraerophilum]MCI1805058.1 phosphoribosylaminoimidazolesuccinocarboxamide synthase [Bifidobacterium psychraerophilum]MCI2175605.1 phosphoribosylaminoimidazolesuccinocarboxamide synthase [Bifidobacterium psychraerophilum]MCI2182099.1 phosphoribosylaminoimidazolesuccinocarboxamide synthase [Bifidobacterium psychraerophilum]
MEKLDLLYQGKAKKLYATDDQDVLWVEYMNQATAGNGAKKEQIEGKGHLNNEITSLMFRLLAKRGIASHFVKQLSGTEQLVRKMTMFPLEIVMRNVAAGSFATRYGIKEGTVLSKPVLEFFYKSDELNDPFINNDDILALELATEEQLEIISAKAREINQALLAIFSSIDVRLVDFKIEMGITSDGMILLADEITPDTCRLWDEQGQGEDSEAIEHLDKDLFRRDLGSIIPAYEEILTRLQGLESPEACGGNCHCKH